jgi:hypothetical protein
MIARVPHPLAADVWLSVTPPTLSLLVKLATVDSYAGVLCHHGHRALLLRPSGPPLGRTDLWTQSRTGSAKSRPPQAHPSNLTAAEGMR